MTTAQLNPAPSGTAPFRAAQSGAVPVSTALVHTWYLTGRKLHALVRQPWVLAFSVIQPAIWLFLFGQLFRKVIDIPGFAFAGSYMDYLVPGLIVAGIGVGLATPTLVSSAMSAVPVHSGGMAAGAVNTMRQLGYAFGIALLGSVFAARAGHVVAAQGGHPAAAQAISGGQAQRLLASVPAGQRDGLDQVVHAASAAGLNGAFLLAGALGLAGAVVVLAAMHRPPTPPAPTQSQATQPHVDQPSAEEAPV